jgi:hypothetical protein
MGKQKIMDRVAARNRRILTAPYLLRTLFGFVSVILERKLRLKIGFRLAFC